MSGFYFALFIIFLFVTIFLTGHLLDMIPNSIEIKFLKTHKFETQTLTFMSFCIMALFGFQSIFPETYLQKMDRLRNEYNNSIRTQTWRDAQEIINITSENNYADESVNLHRQKYAMKKCQPFIKKHYPDVYYKFSKESYRDKEYYPLTIECSNLAKMKQKKSRDKLEENHDTCINHLQKNNHEEYQKHINAITGKTYDKALGEQEKPVMTQEDILLKKDKKKQLIDCIKRSME